MARSVFSKVIRVGKAGALGVGLAVMLALVLGVGTTALAAVPGDPFKLGQLNTVDRITQLVGTTTGAMLKVDNNGAGPALNLQVEPGKAPLTVSPGAGTAMGLSADKLDGKDSSEFAAGVNGKATDAAHADQADSATNAQNAQNATNAQNAANATNAQNAQNADTLDGKDSAQFAQRSGFKATSVIDASGALPKEASFTSNGGTLLISAAGSGYRSSGNTTSDDGMIGMRILVDGQFRDVAYTYTNGADSHKAFVNDYLVVTGLGAGTHTIRLENYRIDQFCGTANESNFDACTTTDSGDNFSVSVLEIPN